MIEKMKMIHVVTTVSHKDEMLEGLRSLGLLHLAERKSANHFATEKFNDLAKTFSRLQDYMPDKKSKETTTPPPVLSDEAFKKMYKSAKEALKKKDSLSQELSAATAEIERLEPWGSFSPSDVRELKKQGIDLHFYRVGQTECEEIMQNESIKSIRLASVEKTDTLAVIGTLPPDIPATEFQLPEKGIDELRRDVEACKAEEAKCTEILKNTAVYENSFQAQILKAQNEENYSSASETAENDEQLVWISGYIPEVDLLTFKESAKKNCWAYAVSDVSPEDETIPTKLRYNSFTKLISPLYDMLGILPGYREADISLWFLIFFALFFAMIIGDGGYGMIFLIGAVILIAKTKQLSTPVFLLLILSISTVVWGAVTGTWFGMESAMKVPFLKSMVLPGFANYPQYFNVEATTQQNNIMKFSFTLGAMQMEIGSLLAVKKKLGEKDLSYVADIGWMLTIVGMYLLSLYLVIGESVAIGPVFVAIAIGFVLVVLFSGMAPGISFSDGVKAGLGGAFTSFLNTISCFGNVMSYIRLFAVGMAGLAISQSFNNMAAGMSSGPLIIAGALVVIIGHVINIVMCILSVVVHGVRLNVLEFSGQVGLEWTGIAYDPFKMNDKIKN
ncbi:V-type ATP synthase subunit I [Oribacterium sp. WCC10]|uniref:V-type ATP synthase subunit I n=1 Tax=Oribacterium sp. WCC10 TaxID=1855343 RepID=UPI0008F13741|nr:V-type ATPase 116kDa subunit family protein [Oribacterium sp. WCC10]SFG48044.1 V/A-type H+-transporting ATPase subunit I [Oribacterium sp. WCC10]